VRIARHPTQRGVYRLTTDLWLPRPVHEIFDYFGDASNLETITPPWLHFHIVSDPKAKIERGSLIDYRLRIRGVPIKWRTEITDWSPPASFEDTQLRGPYRQWIHTHFFHEEDGGTVARDQVDYTMFCAGLANWLMVRRDLVRIFEYRHQTMVRLFGTPRG